MFSYATSNITPLKKKNTQNQCGLTYTLIVDTGHLILTLFSSFTYQNFALNDNWPTLASVIFYWKSASEMLLVVRSPSLEVILARRVDRNLIIPFALNLHWHMLIKLRPTCRDLWLGLLGENLSSCATADYGARAATTLITCHSIRDYMCRAPTKLITKAQSPNPILCNSFQHLRCYRCCGA